MPARARRRDGLAALERRGRVVVGRPGARGSVDLLEAHVVDREAHRVQTVEHLRERAGRRLVHHHLADVRAPVEAAVGHGQDAQRRETVGALGAPELALLQVDPHRGRQLRDRRLIPLRRRRGWTWNRWCRTGR